MWRRTTGIRLRNWPSITGNSYVSRGSKPRWDPREQQKQALIKKKKQTNQRPPAIPSNSNTARTIYFYRSFNANDQYPNPFILTPYTSESYQEMANERKFKDGDLVEVVSDPSQNIPAGTIGEIITYQNGMYAVKFPSIASDPQLSKKLHDCSGLAPDEDGSWLETRHLKAYIRPKIDFDSVVIEDAKRVQILEALEQINQHDLIFETWGFAATIEKGRGVSLLFYGPPGTGKTLMAQAIADKLDKKLKVISTADIESSQPGEAERNIRKHFKDAKDGKTILLFDECDSLIYTRTNVGPILGAQINELLSQIERFNGITVFTTNRLGTLDEAVNRRLALKLEFAMPTQEQRVLIWKRMIPEQAPLASNIDWERLAIIEVTGGYIKNAVLRAARMAAVEKKADADKQITMEHLIEAIKQEAESMIEFDKAREQHERFGGFLGAEGVAMGSGVHRAYQMGAHRG